MIFQMEFLFSETIGMFRKIGEFFFEFGIVMELSQDRYIEDR